MKKKMLCVFAAIAVCFSFQLYAEDDFINIDMSIAPKDSSAAAEPAATAVPAASPEPAATAVPSSAAESAATAVPAAVPESAAAAVPAVQDTPIPPPSAEQQSSAPGANVTEEKSASAEASVEIAEEDTEGIIILSPGETEINRLEEYMAKRRKPAAVGQEITAKKGAVESVEDEFKRTSAQERAAAEAQGMEYQEEQDYDLSFDYGDDEAKVVVVEAEEKATIERAGYVLVEKAGFISKSFSEDGFIYNLDKKEMMVQTDTAFIRITAGIPVKKGTEFMVYSDKEQVIDNDSGEVLGSLIKVAGVAVVLEKAKENTYKVRIKKSYEPIKIDYKIKARRDVKDYHMKVSSKKRGKSQAREVNGAIVKVLGDAVTPSIRSIVYINRGVGDGVLPGDRFSVFQAGREDEKTEDISYDIKGQLLVINAMHNSATALILKHDRLIKAGDSVKSIKK